MMESDAMCAPCVCRLWYDHGTVPIGTEPAGDPHVVAIAEAARELVWLRDTLLAGTGTPELPLKQRTLTNLYNRRPDWLVQAHQQFD